MPKYRYWIPADGETLDDGYTVEATDAEEAAEKAAEQDDGETEYRCVGGTPLVIHVKDPNRDHVTIWHVEGESVPVYTAHEMKPTCADCGQEIGNDSGPPDGWQLEDGRTVCQACCVKDTKKQCKNL